MLQNLVQVCSHTSTHASVCVAHFAMRKSLNLFFLREKLLLEKANAYKVNKYNDTSRNVIGWIARIVRHRVT